MIPSRSNFFATLSVGAVAILGHALSPAMVEAALTTIGPLPYLSSADSPLLNDPSLVTVLEDFEDGALNVPGIVNDPTLRTPPAPNDGRGVVMGPAITTDSVDGDDGLVDGFGNGGHSFRSTDFFPAITFPTTFYSTLVFHFDPLPNGQYPTAFGFVWTDGEPESYVEFLGRELNANVSFALPFPQIVGSNDANGETSEDRFFGVISDVGMERISISSYYFARSETDDGAGRRQFFELDHLQFSYPQIPEPSAVNLLMISLAAAFQLRGAS